ncbi:exonuclease V [Jackrogersella minutella]|nr:exonuclease V [Jackrogersella minutella]
MATSIAPILHGDSSDESDYGSDFSLEEEGIVNQLLDSIGTKTTSSSELASTSSSPSQFALPTDTNIKSDNNSSTIPSLERQNVLYGLGLHSHSENTLPNKAKGTASGSREQYGGNYAARRAVRAPSPIPLDGIQYPDLSYALSGATPDSTSELGPLESQKDSRSPLQRFRSFPKRPLTVSDLASGAWCELQYWYTLTRLPGGRKTRTAAMQGGTRVHQTLEDEVHTTVKVNVTNKEEAFALRLWNVIQGLRTLRDTGMTRELEVWGVIEGQIVNGIIDEVSHESPNTSFEQELSLSQLAQGFATTQSKQQAAITDYLEPHCKKVYLTDVKTRASDRLPTGAALRPARVQLFLYHRLLGEMASGAVDFAVILDRYGLRADALFSDTFMAQVGDLHDEIFYDADSDFGGAPSTPRSSLSGTCVKLHGASPGQSHQTNPPADLIQYRSITQILPLLQSQLRGTFPQGASTLGDLLAVQYRHRDDGRILGNNSFPNDPEALEGYIKENLKWWRGERDADGVSIEETYKCRSCEFAESCQWRKEKEVAFLQRRSYNMRGGT